MVAEVKATAKVVVARQMVEAGGCGGDRRQHGDRESSAKSEFHGRVVGGDRIPRACSRRTTNISGGF